MENLNSNYYPIGTQNDSRAPWNQEQSEYQEEHFTIPVWINNQEQKDFSFYCLISEYEREVTVMHCTNKRSLPEDWEEDVKQFLYEKYDYRINIEFELKKDRQRS